ncbi:MAG: phage major capsid protein [Lachnospiraceae bacterium]|nr:phage major capsid protein [Lachnospiraceae bacterium]
MASTLSRGTLFPPELTNEMFNMVSGKSSLAALSGQKPIPFNGATMFTFNFDKEIDVLGENSAKSNGGVTIEPVTITPIKVEYGTRISDEFKYGNEEVQLQYLQAFADGFAKKVARGIDIMAIHGLNPRTNVAAATIIGNNHFDYKVSQKVTESVNTTADEDVEAMIALVQANEDDVTGMMMSPAFRSRLAALTDSDGRRLYPELGWGAAPGAIKGLPVSVNSTVSKAATGATETDQAIAGNFRDYFRWGFAKEIPIEVIEYGNPDNDTEAGDLKGHNQVYLRGEAYIGWAILKPEAFARVVATV